MSRKTKSELSFLFKISLLFFIMYASKMVKTGTIFKESETIAAEHSYSNPFQTTIEVSQN